MMSWLYEPLRCGGSPRCRMWRPNATIQGGLNLIRTREVFGSFYTIASQWAQVLHVNLAVNIRPTLYRVGLLTGAVKD